MTPRYQRETECSNAVVQLKTFCKLLWWGHCQSRVIFILKRSFLPVLHALKLFPFVHWFQNCFMWTDGQMVINGHFLASGRPLPHDIILDMSCLVKISGNTQWIPVANLSISRCDESDVPWQCHYFVCGFLPPLLRLPCNELIFLWMAGQRLFSYVCLAKLSRLYRTAVYTCH